MKNMFVFLFCVLFLRIKTAWLHLYFNSSYDILYLVVLGWTSVLSVTVSITSKGMRFCFPSTTFSYLNVLARLNNRLHDQVVKAIPLEFLVEQNRTYENKIMFPTEQSVCFNMNRTK